MTDLGHPPRPPPKASSDDVELAPEPLIAEEPVQASPAPLASPPPPVPQIASPQIREAEELFDRGPAAEPRGVEKVAWPDLRPGTPAAPVPVPEPDVTPLLVSLASPAEPAVEAAVVEEPQAVVTPEEPQGMPPVAWPQVPAAGPDLGVEPPAPATDATAVAWPQVAGAAEETEPPADAPAAPEPAVEPEDLRAVAWPVPGDAAALAEPVVEDEGPATETMQKVAWPDAGAPPAPPAQEPLEQRLVSLSDVDEDELPDEPDEADLRREERRQRAEAKAEAKREKAMNRANSRRQKIGLGPKELEEAAFAARVDDLPRPVRELVDPAIAAAAAVERDTDDGTAYGRDAVEFARRERDRMRAEREGSRSDARSARLRERAEARAAKAAAKAGITVPRPKEAVVDEPMSLADDEADDVHPELTEIVAPAEAPMVPQVEPRPFRVPPGAEKAPSPAPESQSVFERARNEPEPRGGAERKSALAGLSAAAAAAKTRVSKPTAAERERDSAQARAAAAQALSARRAANSGPQRSYAPAADRDRALSRARAAASEPSSSASAAKAPASGSGLSLGSLIGALGMVLAVVLAVGALLVALGANQTEGIVGVIATICDALAGWLRGLFDLSGPNSRTTESLVAWGLGSVIYLGVGLVAQGLSRKS